MSELKPWQREAADWLRGKRFALLCDEQRVGKTLAALTAAVESGATRVVVACPVPAVAVWQAAKQDLPGCALVVLPYSKPPPEGLQADVLILDEFHYLKSPTAKRTKAFLGKGSIVHRAQKTWLLSGTPMPNSPAELWVVCYVFGLWKGTHAEFLARYTSGYTHLGKYVVTGGRNMAELRALLAPYMMRRTLADVAPESAKMTVECVKVEGLKPRIKGGETIRAFPDELREWLKSESPKLPSSITALPSIRHYTSYLKVFEVMTTVNILVSMGRKVVLFGVHRLPLFACEGLLPAGMTVVVTGDTPGAERAALAKRFREDPNCRVFIGQIIAAGVAIDLSSAQDIVFLEADLVPGNNAQAMMRCMNINNTEPVRVTFIALENSIDQEVDEILARKAAMIDAVVGTGTCDVVSEPVDLGRDFRFH